MMINNFLLMPYTCIILSSLFVIYLLYLSCGKFVNYITPSSQCALTFKCSGIKCHTDLRLVSYVRCMALIVDECFGVKY